MTTKTLPTIAVVKEPPLIEEDAPLLPYLFAKKHRAIAYRTSEQTLFIAASEPLSRDALEDIRFGYQKQVEVEIVSAPWIDQILERRYHRKEVKETEDPEKEAQISSVEGYDLLGREDSSKVVRICDAILLEAISQKSSDIHFEPQEDRLLVRFRVDGVLHEQAEVPKNIQSELIARLKVLAKLDIAESRLPQDGRMKLSIGERQIDFRVSTVPVVFGERVVLRILDKKNLHLGLDAIGLPPDLLEEMSRLLTKTQGIFLVTGPTGSGKTTTLYSALEELKSTAMNIMTIEDPVEYKLPYMAQIGVNPKINLTFSNGLRHILRQDPDVIMVGEIRDRETAEIAIQASLTGHLVLSTLHTNDALSAPMRLIDMGIEPFLIFSSLVGILAQRLVRVICPECKEFYAASNLELKDLGLSAEPRSLCRGRGCSHCFGLGYKGRVGIYELLVMTPTMKTLFQRPIDGVERERLAFQEGFRTLRQQGIEMVLKGITTVEEIVRVTGRGEA